MRSYYVRVGVLVSLSFSVCRLMNVVLCNKTGVPFVSRTGGTVHCERVLRAVLRQMTLIWLHLVLNLIGQNMQYVLHRDSLFGC